jgi:hypothetical protein
VNAPVILRRLRPHQLLTAVGQVGVMASMTLIAAFEGPAAEAAPVPVPEPACGATITRSVTLTKDLTCGDEVFTVAAPNVVVDLGGRTVRSTGSCRPSFELPVCGLGIVGAPGARLVNGRLESVTLSVASENATVSGLSINDAAAVVVRSGVGITGNTFVRTGLLVRASAEVSGNSFYRAGIQSTNTDRTIKALKLIDNVVVEAPGAGILLNVRVSQPGDLAGEVTGNIVARSGDAGIAVVGNLDSLGALTVARNVLLGNTSDGVRVSSDPPYFGTGVARVDLGWNVAVANAGFGINAPWAGPGRPSGIADKGGNMALANGRTPACVGASC